MGPDLGGEITKLSPKKRKNEEICRGLRRHVYGGYVKKNIFFVIKTLVWIKIWIGSGFSNRLDPHPESVNPGPKHCSKPN
jgi:hypothetical protein